MVPALSAYTSARSACAGQIHMSLATNMHKHAAYCEQANAVT
jgi:hypothetical protein